MWIEVDEYPSELLTAASLYEKSPFVRSCSEFYDTYGYLTPKQIGKLTVLNSLFGDSPFKPMDRAYCRVPPDPSTIAIPATPLANGCSIREVTFGEIARNHDALRSMTLPPEHNYYAYFTGAGP